MIRRTFCALASWAFVVAAVAVFCIYAASTQQQFSADSEIAASADQGNPRFMTGPNVLPPVLTPDNVWISNSTQSNTATISK